MIFKIVVYDNEEWKLIPNTDGYFVSNKGRVKSSDIITKQGKCVSGQILSTTNINSYGYPRCTVRTKDGIRKEYLIHRLVASLFIPNNDINKTEVNHKDENKLNNDVNNLEWCTKEYNNIYGNRSRKAKEKQADEYKLYDVYNKCYINKIFIGLKEVAAFLNVSVSTVYENKDRYTLRGYKIINISNKHNTLLKEEDLK